MALPNVNLNFLPPQINFTEQDFTNIPMVIGASSKGTVGQVYTIAQKEDLAQLGNGPAVHLLANCLVAAQTPIYYTKPTNTNAGTLSSVTKIIGNPVGTPTPIGTLNSSLIFTAKTTGVSVTITQQVGNTLAATATFVGGLLTINLGTDGGGAGNSTPNAIVTLLNTIVGLGTSVIYTAGGTGLGIMIAAANTPLPFGSTSAATIAGTVSDQYNVLLKITRAGSLPTTPPLYRLAFDGDPSKYTSDLVMPSTGVTPIKFGTVDTGVTMTLTGAFDVGDTFTFVSTAPTVGINDILTAMNAAIADSFIRYGHFLICDTVDRNALISIDAVLQAVKDTQFLQAMVHARDQGEGVPGETTAQWQLAISQNFQGLYIVTGLEAVFAGSVNSIDQYTNLLQKRSNMFGEAPNRAAGPIQQSIGYLPLDFIGISPLDGKAIYYDERVTPGLDSQRFIVPCTRIGRVGEYFSNRGWTFADPATIGYDRTDYVNLAMQIADILYRTCQPLLMQKFNGIAVAESSAVPAGALGKADADKIQSLLTAAVNNYLTRPQPRGGDTPGTLIPNPVTVLRNYNFALTRELRISAKEQPKGTAELITILLGVQVPNT
jgi:hypothetical protein